MSDDEIGHHARIDAGQASGVTPGGEHHAGSHPRKPFAQPPESGGRDEGNERAKARWVMELE